MAQISMQDITRGSPHQLPAEMSSITLQPTSPSYTDSSLDCDVDIPDPGHRSRSYIICLVLGMAGVQVAFSIQFSTGIVRSNSRLFKAAENLLTGVSKSYFRSLGVSQSASTLIWLVPPACGAFLQPLFGRWSDACRSRKPFVVFGGLGIVIALVGYAWSPELAALISGPDESQTAASAAAARLAQLSALFFFVALNVSVQPVQSGLRALVVDKCHAGQQIEANAWASRINHVAGMISYLAAASDVAGIVPIGSTQLQALVVLSIIVVIGSLSVTCCVVTESRKTDFAVKKQAAGEGVLAAWKLLSLRLRRIYFAQFFSWFAWFPVLVQITSFINTMSCSLAAPSTTLDADHPCKTAGASALFTQSCVALLMSFLLPVLVRRAPSTAGKLERYSGQDRARSDLRTLQNLWFASQMLFAALVSTAFYESSLLTILAIALTGMCWCVTQWVPFVLANDEVIRIEERRKLAGMESRTGVLLGAHNTFIAFPQILATGVSSILFEALKAVGSSDPLDDILWVFSMSICMTLVAAYLLARL